MLPRSLYHKNYIFVISMSPRIICPNKTKQKLSLVHAMFSSAFKIISTIDIQKKIWPTSSLYKKSYFYQYHLWNLSKTKEKLSCDIFASLQFEQYLFQKITRDLLLNNKKTIFKSITSQICSNTNIASYKAK